jgi:hypothetical protein
VPADRMLHPKCGHSHKVSMLTDLEFRVWIQYLLSADDFGVMLDNPAKLQSDNRHLLNRKARELRRCLDGLVTAGLLRRFEHQGQAFLFSGNWQRWQKVEYPRASDMAKPPDADLHACEDSTRELFAKHPGGQRKDRRRPEDVPSDSGRASQIDPEQIPTTRAGAPAERLTLTANANGLGQRQTAALPRRRLDAAYEHESGLYVPNRAHQDLLPMHSGREQELFEWYPSVCAAWAGRNTGADMIKFWKARHDETWPPERTAVPKKPWAPLQVTR